MLLNCIECNRKISSTAKVCPQCGYKNQEFLIDGKVNPNYKLPELNSAFLNPESEQVKANRARTRKQSAFWNPILSILFLIFLFWCIYVCVFPPAWL